MSSSHIMTAQSPHSQSHVAHVRDALARLLLERPERPYEFLAEYFRSAAAGEAAASQSQPFFQSSASSLSRTAVLVHTAGSAPRVSESKAAVRTADDRDEQQPRAVDLVPSADECTTLRPASSSNSTSVFAAIPQGPALSAARTRAFESVESVEYR